MSAGEINIEVKSEGADDAAQNAQDSAQGGGGGQGGGGDTLGTAMGGGIVGGLLSQALGPLIDILDPILKMLQAFLAPVAVMLMRLLAPVLRVLVKLLPAWFRFMDKVLPYLAVLAIVPVILWRLIRDLGIWFKNLPGKIWNQLKTWAGKVRKILNMLPQKIWNFMTDLPSDIGAAVANNIPGVNAGQNTIDRGQEAYRGGFTGNPNTSVNVNIDGSAEKFVDWWVNGGGFG